jgi:hypothetical protein
MSENELDRKDRLVSLIKARVRALVFLVQDDDHNRRFEPGLCWWIETLGVSAKTAYPEGVHFCDQIGVSQKDFEFALGRKWLMSKEFPYSHIRTRRIQTFTFVTVGLINPFSDYGSEVESPAKDSSLIVSSPSSPSWAIPVGQLLRSINDHRTLMQQEPKKTTAELVMPPSIVSKPRSCRQEAHFGGH